MRMITPKNVFLQQDMKWLASQLGNIRASIRVEDPSFSHGDFVWSTRLVELVNHPVINLISSG